MILKYRGTMIRLFSLKRFILVTLGVCAIFAVLVLYEIIIISSLNNVDSLYNSRGSLALSLPQTSPRPQKTATTPAVDRIKLSAAAKENINNFIPQERISRILHPTIELTQKLAEKENINNTAPQERISATLHPTIELTQKQSVPRKIAKLREIVRYVNNKQYIRNEEKFGRDFSQRSIVIVVQVHDRVGYFSHLLRSLSRAKGIEDALLIISNDYYSGETNKLVKSIDFCRVIQIFFPFSLQLYPNEFPGSDPNDCPRNITKEKAKEMGCNNADTPDMFGHYREARYTMTKHHWWWKANKVFDMLDVTKTYMGPVLFLEEDYYVSPDFYHMLRLLYESKMSGCKDNCDMITLATYRRVHNYTVDGAENVAELSTWRSYEHNMGLAFDRTTWNKIKKCNEVFCKTYDEYNWDWSLMKMSISCLSQPFTSLVLKGPRVFHLGECGLHHKRRNCNINATVQKYQNIIDRNTNSFFPSTVDIQPGRTGQGSIKRFKANGGWGDSRDHALCFQLMQDR